MSEHGRAPDPGDAGGGALTFDREYPFEYGAVGRLTPLIRRVVARNPSPFTFHGTGTFIVGNGEVAVIDPGPDLDEHVAALLAALDGERVTHLVVTHTHRDHSPACRAVQAATGAPTYGFGPHAAGRLEAGAEVEAGADTDFVPDVAVRDGDVIEGAGWTLECVHTPGHTSNHVCYALREERALFSGDHVMGWNTTVISPPDGDMGDYLASLRRLLERDDAVYWPTHGPPIRRPRSWVRAYLSHRALRERQIAACLAGGPCRVAEMVTRMYTHLPARMHTAAARTVLATLVHLVGTGAVLVDGAISMDAHYRLPHR